MKTTRRLRRFTFDADTRASITRAGGAVMTLPTGRLSLSPTTTTGVATTALWKPMAAESFNSIEVVASNPSMPDGRRPSTLRLRLRDSVGEGFWNGTAWVPAVGADDWNEVSEVEMNLSSWMPTRKKRELGFVVRLDTVVAGQAPVVSEIKVLWKTARDPQEDALVRGLLPFLRGVRYLVDLETPAAATATSSMTVAGFKIETPYTSLSFDSVFDQTADPEHFVNLLAAPGGTSATLSPALPAGHIAAVRLLAEPVVAITTSQDFIEVARTPAVEISNVSFNATERGVRDTFVAHVAGNGVVFPPGLQGDMVITLEVVADKQRDLQRLIDGVRRLIVSTPLLTLPGVDEKVGLRLTDDLSYGNDATGSMTNVDVYRAQIGIQLTKLTVNLADGVDAPGVLALSFNGGASGELVAHLARFGESVTAPTTAAAIRALRGARRAFARSMVAHMKPTAGQRTFVALPTALGTPTFQSSAGDVFAAVAVDVDVDGVPVTVWGGASAAGGSSTVEVF